MLLSHNNSFVSEADIVIGDVLPVLFLLNIVYFSVCLTSNKLYWIEDQLADVSTLFYTSASWRRRVGPSAS